MPESCQPGVGFDGDVGDLGGGFAGEHFGQFGAGGAILRDELEDFLIDGPGLSPILVPFIFLGQGFGFFDEIPMKRQKPFVAGEGPDLGRFLGVGVFVLAFALGPQGLSGGRSSASERMREAARPGCPAK